ncbi:TPA: response regulator transcription factor [Burkholderia aenigmatica]|uniref:response regulator n=1 Tax=Burkholderia sp. AU45251 TaxID=3059204 RepID=UPI0026570EA3|nr:response regulator transcription factor [Burkholderia sp. AU45251]HDR9487003.1 response regulator transcription factor [Burkholderia aenigmatica]MDN7520350.1 response regulator transcription factor [Burkholderia sp. AU45251]HDR9518886.1 response regulator transcription factor [Burkholderia aenigmatica]HDR9595753.1 response regulator transcription factor [Burkholderia aenigmatica]HDR9602714.1 response regulator transcription factor [Burkholderia aenigmatica]
MPPRLSILLVDDHAVVREGYKRLIEFESDLYVCGEARHAAEAYPAFCALRPDVVVMEVSLPGPSGIEAIRRMLARERAAHILIFSVREETMFVRRSLAAGALGYVTKASAPDVLVDAVRTVARGRRFLSPDVAQALHASDAFQGGQVDSTLSAREFEVLGLLIQGYTLLAIGEKLGISRKTVANHQSMLRQKFGADNSVQLARMAGRFGLPFQSVPGS